MRVFLLAYKLSVTPYLCLAIMPCLVMWTLLLVFAAAAVVGISPHLQWSFFYISIDFFRNIDLLNGKS